MDQEQERNISRLWRAFKTVKEMVKDRGYFITQEEIDLSLEDFKVKYCDSMGKPQRKMMSFQSNPTDESLEKFPGMGSLWVESVSYAHLDVYKRQVQRVRTCVRRRCQCPGGRTHARDR